MRFMIYKFKKMQPQKLFRGRVLPQIDTGEAGGYRDGFVSSSQDAGEFL